MQLHNYASTIYLLRDKYYIKSSREEWRSHFFFNGIEARCMHILNRCILLSFCAILNSPLDSVLLDEDTLLFKRFVHEFQPQLCNEFKTFSIKNKR